MRLTTVNANAYRRNLSHSERSINISMVEHTMITAQKLRRRSRAIRRPFFGYVDLKKKRVGYPSVMHFEGRLTSGLEEICDLFAPPFGALQFTSDEVESLCAKRSGSAPMLTSKSCKFGCQQGFWP
jgi:hypothetical protein